MEGSPEEQLSHAAQITPRRFLFVLWEGGGNVPPLLGLAGRLLERGHTVRVISDPANAADAQTAGCEFTPYRRAPHRRDKTAASTIVDDYSAMDSTRALYTIFDKMSAGPSLAYAQDVLEELDNHPADVVVASELLFGGLFAAEKAGLPGVMVIPGGYSLYAPHMPIPGMLPQAGLLGWVQDKLHAAVFRRLFTHPLPALRKARAELGLPDFDDVSEYLNRLPAVLALTSPAFEFAARFPPNVHFTGPVLDDPPLVEAWQSPWPASGQRPLVIVSFGTTYQRQEDLIKKAIQAISDLPYRGLVTLGPAISLDQFSLPSNVHMEQFVSHAQVLPQAAAVVTHAGHGTVIRALAHGVPLVCIPLGRDQPSNAARVIAQGAGLRLSAKANAQEIHRAIKSVVENPCFGQNAQRLSKSILTDAQSTTAVEVLEQVRFISR